jgi:dipeptidyl aminopeptidase/acylaminoacyl peptidase
MLRKLFPALLLCLCAGGAFADNAGQLPVETFFTYAKITQIKISPDGKYLAMIVSDDKTGESRKILAVVTADSSHKLTATFRTIGDQLISDLYWAGNDRVLTATATQTGSFDPPFGDGALWAVNVDGTQKKQLMPTDSGNRGSQQLVGASSSRGEAVYFWGMLHRDLKDPKHVTIYGGTYQGASYDQPEQAYELDIYTGALRQIVQSPTLSGGFVTDNQGNVRLATGDKAASGDQQIFYRADGSTLEWKDLSALYDGADPAGDDIGPEYFMPDDKHIYWFGHTPTSTVGLYDLDPDTLALKPLFTDPTYDVNDVVFSFEWSKPAKIVAVETMPGLPQVHVLDPDDLEIGYLTSLYQAFDGQHVEITSNTADHTQMVVHVKSDRNPGDFYLFDTKTGKVTFLFSAKPEIDPSKMATMRPVEFQARDGLTLHGYLTLPPNSSGKNLPLIINPHGGPHGIRDEWGWDPEVQFFANRGYAVLQVNYRGSGGYGMKFQDMGYNNWGTTMQDDLADGVNWAVQQGIADLNRICIYGASYGGYAALENPIRYPDLYKCAVGYAGVYDLTLQGKRGDTHHYASGKKYLNVVHSDGEERMKQYSPAYNADKLKAALFIVYSGHDQRVVPQNSEELMSALDKLGKKYELMYEPNEMHGYYKSAHRIELYTKMLAFFDKYIGPNAAKP